MIPDTNDEHDDQVLAELEAMDIEKAKDGPIMAVTKAQSQPLPLAKTEPAKTPQECRTLEVTEALAPAYAKASTLDLTDDECQKLMAPFPDSDVDIRPHDGLIYISHIHISDRLNQVFRPGKWALVRRREWLENGVMYAEYVLLIRGCYVGESIGGHPYVANNPKVNYSDTLEATAGEALRRISGKRLSCGSQVWKSDYAKTWVATHAEQRRDGKWQKKARPVMGNPITAPAPAPAKPAAKVETPEARKARFIALCIQAGGGKPDFALDLFREMAILLPTETLEDFPLDKVPNTREMADNIFGEIRARAGVADPPPAEAKPAPPVAPSQPPLVPEDEPWKAFVMPFGAQKGKSLGELPKNYLYGLWANYVVETEFRGKPKDPAKIAADRELRAMLDLAGQHYQFTKKD